MDGRPVAIVTGAASGIGRATVDRLVASGHPVVAGDLAWAEERGDATCVEADVATEDGNAALVESAGRLGSLGIVVLNAGVVARGPVDVLPMAEFDRVLAVNVRGVALGLRAAIPDLRAGGGGSVVVTASTCGFGGDPGLWAYNASKAGVLNLVRAAALDLAPSSIRVNAVCPGPTHTGMTSGVRSSPEAEAAMCRSIPLHRFAEPEEIAAVITFLASPDASFVTGAAVPVDGGIGASTGQFPPP